MKRMEERVPATNYENLQYFLSEARGNSQLVNNQIARDVDRYLGVPPDSCLYIDETGISKKGKMSVGVNRQGFGRLGKTENCQVGISGVLGRDKYASPIDHRLYLPKVWTYDPAGCRKAKAPEELVVFKSKHELALEMIIHARANGVRFNWVGCDGLYGQNPWFLRKLDEMKEIFIADVLYDQRFYLDTPEPYVPERKSRCGRPPKN